MSAIDLVAARLDRGLTVSELAGEIGVSRGVIERLENGKRCSPANAKKVADFYGVVVTQLPAFAPARPGTGPQPVEPWHADAKLETDGGAATC